MAFSGGVKFSKNRKIIKSAVLYDFIPSRVKLSFDGCVLCCKLGDKVTAGQTVATCDGGGELHSSVSGVIREIQDGVLTIEACDEEKPEFINMPLFEGSISVDNRESMIDYVMKSGIMQDGDFFGKRLKECIASGVTRLVINCVEDLPCSCTRYKVIESTPAEVVGGAKILLAILGIRSGIFAIEKSRKKLASLIEKQRYPGEMFSISLMPSKYPVSFPEVILNELFYSPSTDKVLVVTPDICLQIYDAFVHGVAYVGHTVSVTCGKKAVNLYLPAGSLYDELEEYMGSDIGRSQPYGYASVMAIENSPLHGDGCLVDEGYLTPSVRCITIFARPIAVDATRGECMECGRCGEVCPMELEPLFIYRSLSKGNYEKARLYGVDRCIACGCCSYVCPGAVEHIKLIKEYKKQEKAPLSAVEQGEKEENNEA